MALPRPTDVELRILDAFWDAGPSTVRRIHERLVEQPDRRETSYSTTLRMIQVLHEKGFLTRDESVRPQVYRPTASREQIQRSVLDDVTQRLFGGAMTDLVQCALRTQGVTPSELDEMQRLIRKAKKGDLS